VALARVNRKVTRSGNCAAAQADRTCGGVEVAPRQYRRNEYPAFVWVKAWLCFRDEGVSIQTKCSARKFEGGRKNEIQAYIPAVTIGNWPCKQRRKLWERRPLGPFKS